MLFAFQPTSSHCCSLFGWKANSNANWSVQEGVIAADEGDPGLLLTTFQLADYELLCDFRLEAGGNSGIFLRTLFEPKDPSVDCYELNLCDSHATFPTGSFVGRQKIEPRGGCRSKLDVEGAWHTYRIRVEGRRILVTLDGKHVLDFADASDQPRTIGHIGLQMNGGKIEFRNVLLRPLSTRPIFNGKDLSGWRTVPGSKGRFEVTDGTIHVGGGPGFLETDSTWGDFVLQTEVRTNEKNINSGIFFRAERATQEAPSNGYELQIHNGFADGDRTKPNDYGSGFGTGAIFRRVKARRIVADDGDWFSMTLIAGGPHFSTWVDGYQVVDWTDKREAHANPRRGKRLPAGHISLQGHDPSTDLNFKNLRIAEIPDE